MNPSFHNWAADRRLKGLVFLVLALMAVALAAYTHLSIKQGKYAASFGPTTISVRGAGEVQKIPDIATFSFIVHAENIEPVSAQKASAEAVNAIIAYLKENGTAETDIKTLSYNLSPQYKYTNEACGPAYCPPTIPRIVGYAVDQTVQVKVRDTNKAGALLSGVGEHGAKDISGLTFTIDDDTAAKAEARAKAITDAKEKAEQLADALAVRLVRLTGFYEEENGGPYPMYDKGYGGGVTAMDSDVVAPQVPSGENTINVAVNLTYEIE
jgi:uncharacterized protein YggE